MNSVSEKPLEMHGNTEENDIDDFLNKFDDAQMSGNSQMKADALEHLRTKLNEKGLKNIGKLFKKCAFPEVKAIVTQQIQGHVIRLVSGDMLDTEGIISLLDFSKNDADHKQSVNIMCEAFETLQGEILKKLLCDIIIPGIFDTNLDNKIRDSVIDVGFQLIKIYPITNLNAHEVRTFISVVLKTYSETLEKLREQNYARWSDLWMFLIRFSGRHLHNSMDLTNKLLRVVEFAFRNPSYEQRLKGYDCWKELIDNASLDMTRMCSNKQIRLLITPLRAKFSKMVVVICKRFEVFIYLIEKLQNHSVLCLNEFLEFCFGVSRSNSNNTKNGQGKLVPELWLKIIHVFLAILGDQTYILQSMNKALFDGPVINENNIDKFDQVIIYSMIESSVMLKKTSITSHDKITLMSALWEALFNILEKSSPEIQEQCFQLIFRSLGTIFKEFNEDITYIGLSSAFTQSLESTIDHRLLSDSLKLFLEYCLKFLSEKDVSSEFFQQFCDLIQISCKQVHIVDFFVEQLKKLEPSKNESKIYKVWNLVGNKLTDNFSNSSKTAVQFFLWPVHHLQKFGGQLLTDICAVWLKLFMKAAKTSKPLKKTVVNELDKCFKSNPLLGSNIVSLISEIAQKDFEFDKELVKALFKLMANIVSLPLLPQESTEKLCPLILKCTNFIAVQTAEAVGVEFLSDVFQCVEKIPIYHKNKALVEILEKLVKKMNDASAEKKLKDLLSSFPDPSLQKSSLSLQEQSNDLVISTPKRSVRMAQMVIDSSSINANKNKITALQIFGKDIDTMTPLKVKGSMLGQSPNSRSKKIINSVKKTPEPPVIEDHTSDFVVIDTEVNLQKDKLTEHQKEELKRRREDIPALYQDLSQSHSQSESLSSSMSCLPNLKQTDQVPKLLRVDSVEFIHLNNDEPSTSTTGNIENNMDTNVNDKKKTRELKRIKMDLVGANSFFTNLPSKRQRRSTNVPEKAQENEQGHNESQEVEPFVSHITAESTKPIKQEIIEEANSLEVVLPPEIVPVAPANPELETDPKAKISSNNRKNKLIKPKKHTVSPKPMKRAKKSDNESIIPRRKRKPKQEGETPKKAREKTIIKVKPPVFSAEKTRKRDSSPRKNNSEQILSEPLFESQLETEVKRRKKKTNNATEQAENSQNSTEVTTLKREESQKHRTPKDGKLKGRQKDLMKRNKEKIRTIQSQLQLANLSDISVASESKKAKGAKLIFIREITNSKNTQDTKVTPAGLKRNKDKKSSNIAYTIETPVDSVPLALGLESFPSTSTINPEEPVTEARGGRKRKRSTDYLSSSDHSTEKLTKRKSKDKTITPKTIDKSSPQVSPKSIAIKKIERSTESTLIEEKNTTKNISPDNEGRLTRSRASSLSPISGPITTPKTEPIKSIRTLFAESEDIIESSQSQTEENISCANLIKIKSKPSPKPQNIHRNQSLDDVEAPFKPAESEHQSTEKEIDTNPENANQPTSLAETETCDSNYETLPAVVNVDLPEKPELTDSEKVLSNTSTVSIEVSMNEEKLLDTTPEKEETIVEVFKDIDTNETTDEIRTCSPVTNIIEYTEVATPEKSSSDNLPGSPINNVTPTLTQEFLDNTLDISPISSQESEEVLKEDNDILKKLEAAIEDCANATEQTEKVAEDPVIPNDSNDKPVKVGLSLNLRSNKLLNMVNVGTPVTHKPSNLKRIISSPSLAKSRNDKLFSFFNGMKEEEKAEQKEESTQDVTGNQEDILTFSREIPSPFAVPSSSIMKRKLADTDDNFSPVAKRKRVNFSFPCISSVKHYIRHQEEINKSYKPSFPQNLFNMFEEEDSEDDDPFANPKPETQSETEESLDITDPSLLSKKDHIFPSLIDCKAPINKLSKHLSSPEFAKTLRKILMAKNINTIGDLARLSELEIKRLPFKHPRLKVVRKVLNIFYNKEYKKNNENVNSENNGDCSLNISNDMVTNDEETKDENIELAIAEVPHTQILDVREEFKKALQRVKDENILLEDFGSAFLDLVDESEIVALLKSVYQTDVKKFFEKSHWRYLIQSIVQTGGTSEMFEIISDLAENNKIFADQLETIVQLRIRENPLKDIIKQKTLAELENAVENCIDNGVFDRSDVLQTCLMPLIKNPSDLKYYFTNLTIVQIFDLFVERVQPSDLTVFLDQITEHYGEYTIAQSVNRSKVLKICSKEELMNSLAEKENEVETVKNLISKIGDQSKIVELFKFITDLVPVKNRIDSYIEFLQSIQNDK